MAGPIIRRDVGTLQGPWHPLLQAYAFAIAEMQNSAAQIPIQWEYQAEIHGVGLPSDPPPDEFRSQCQHNCWYFLPWHRWYLFYFEQIIRSVLRTIPKVSAADADAWALPYWDYSRPSAQTLPFEFAQEFMPDGKTPNPLFDRTRDPKVNARTRALAIGVTTPGPGVLDQAFSSTNQFVPTFGGTASGWHHFREPGTSTGGLEATPHNNVHGFVGGNMLDFATAGLDPIFWLHHCNLDRYWEVRGHGSDPVGWDRVTFSFRDATGAVKKVTADGCVNTVQQLGYRYDNVNPPGSPTPGHAVRSVRMAEGPAAPPPPPEIVGTHAPLTLSGRTRTARFALNAVSNQFRSVRGGNTQPSRVYLSVDDIRGDDDPGISYAVYLHSKNDDQLAGYISFFGVRGTRNGPHALAYTFDVTDIVKALSDEDAWDPADVQVVFEPVGGVDDDGTMQTSSTEIDIGAVNIVYQ
jgi:tyrosinase